MHVNVFIRYENALKVTHIEKQLPPGFFIPFQVADTYALYPAR